jgi:hypothetical protein
VIVPDENVSDLLIKRGWSQGNIFESPETRSWITTLQEDGSSAVEGLVTPSTGTFLVISQKCDIAAPLSRKPVIEAIPCSVEPNPADRQKARNSFRWFDLEANDLLAHAMYRTSFDKRSLLQLQPHPWPGTPQRFKRFTKWLSRRASRAVLEDDLVEAIVNPLRNLIGKQKKSRVGRLFSDVVRELRISLPMEELVPFQFHLIVLMATQDLTEEQFQAVGQMESRMRECFNPDRAILRSDQLSRTLQRRCPWRCMKTLCLSIWTQLLIRVKKFAEPSL